MVFKVLDPLAEIKSASDGKAIRSLQSYEGKRLGLLWNQHSSSEKFWPVLERVAEEILKPAEVHRLYKKGTWNPAPLEDLGPFLERVDYVITGVGG